MKKEKIKKIFIKSIPTLWILMCLCMRYIEAEFRTNGTAEILISAIISSSFCAMLIHPLYLAVCSYKEKGTKFFMPFLEIIILLLPYFIILNDEDTFSRDLGKFICACEYFYTTVFWIIAYIVKRYKIYVTEKRDAIKFESKKRIMGLLWILNFLPLLFIGITQGAMFFGGSCQGVIRDMIFMTFYTEELALCIVGGVYYAKINYELQGSGLKSVCFSAIMLLVCAGVQLLLCFASEADKLLFYWLLIKYIVQFIILSITWFNIHKSENEKR